MFSWGKKAQNLKPAFYDPIPHPHWIINHHASNVKWKDGTVREASISVDSKREREQTFLESFRFSPHLNYYAHAESGERLAQLTRYVLHLEDANTLLRPASAPPVPSEELLRPHEIKQGEQEHLLRGWPVAVQEPKT